MIKYIPLIALIFLLMGCNKNAVKDSLITQDTPFLNTDYIKTKTAYFSIDANYNIQGNGKKVIEDFVNNSQFIVYGEMHNSKQTSIITKALMPLLKKASFNYFAIEVGSHSAETLTNLATPSENTVKNLKEFNSTYTLRGGGETANPIPFFTGVSDAEFLEESQKNDMQLWGIDQEYYYATFFMFDELLATAKENSNFKNIKALKQTAHDATVQYFIKEIANDDYETYAHILKDKDVLNFFNAFSNTNTKAQQIIEDLKISWDIYVRWRDDSHVDRISYMRNNFTKYYLQATNTETLPKVFTKIGNLHASKIVSNGAYDVGNLTEQLAKKNGTNSTTINSWKPYEIENDTLINNLERYKRGYRRYRLFTDLAHKNEWTIIDLKSIRDEIKKGRIKLPENGDYHKLKRLIEGYDYQLILPIDEVTVLNKDA